MSEVYTYFVALDLEVDEDPQSEGVEFNVHDEARSLIRKIMEPRHGAI